MSREEQRREGRRREVVRRFERDVEEANCLKTAPTLEQMADEAAEVYEPYIERLEQENGELRRFIEDISKQRCYRTETEAGGCAPCEAFALLNRLNDTREQEGHGES